jgi:putative FmdB family regulatory protein
MPIYEYEPDERDCLLCEGRLDVIQNIDEESLKTCPWCGLSVNRVISRASINIKTSVDPDSAAKKGFSTFRKLETGKWEKVAGPDVESSEPPLPKGELNLNDFDE